MKGKYKCKVCGKKFELSINNRYTVINKKAFIEAIISSSTEYDAFDCPYCGCQNIVNVRECNNEEINYCV